MGRTYQHGKQVPATPIAQRNSNVNLILPESDEARAYKLLIIPYKLEAIEEEANKRWEKLNSNAEVL